MIRLRHRDWALSLNPALGAAVTRLTWRGRDILRPAPDDTRDLLATASFPLAPYANRIADGAFTFDGHDLRLPPTPGFEPHALHGMGWRRPWRVAEATQTAVDLGLEQDRSDEWPWSWAATHRAALTEDGVAFDLEITNMDTRPMPAGLGLHPYFAAEGTTVLTVPADRVWSADARQIPTALVPAGSLIDWSAGVRLADAPFVDNAYAGWSGAAVLDHGDCRVTMTASGNADWAHVYAPPGEGFVCVEPVTHRPDAHNAPAGEASGLVVLQPGQTLSMSMRIAAEPIIAGDRS